jgi:sterol 3beta-glucosyltransferase
VQCIYRDMEYATNLIRSKAGKNHARRDSAAAACSGDADGDDIDEEEEEEESWTFVGADAESQDDLSPENVLKRTAADFRVASPALGAHPTPTRALGSRVLGTPGSGSGGSRLN